jgi:hypothetical protein
MEYKLHGRQTLKSVPVMPATSGPSAGRVKLVRVFQRYRDMIIIKKISRKLLK